MALDVDFDKAFYRPGEPVAMTVILRQGNEWDGHGSSAEPLYIEARASHLTQTVQEVLQQFGVEALARGVRLALAAPTVAPRGYGLDLALRDGKGRLLAQRSAGFDVLNHWTEAPRYGFLCDFDPEREDAAETMQHLRRYHINSLQFYDWMYRHDTLLPPQDVYCDPLGREMSLQTVQALIDAAHACNIAAMPYTAVYAASPEFYEQHAEWALLDKDGAVQWFADCFLAYMDPRADSGWTRHLLAQFDHLLHETDFDGVHLDQYGEPRRGYDASGCEFELQTSLAALIAASKEVVRRQRDHGAVVFNCVGNWPVHAVASAPQDLVYIEVWEPFITLVDLSRLVTDAQQLGGGKAVVLAAYIDPVWEPNMRLMDAVIFASGGARIELGEQADVLADPYFPKYRRMTSPVAAAMRRLYDFAVRYQDVIGPRTKQAADDVRVFVLGAETGPFPSEIWPIVRHSGNQQTVRTAISLINLQGLPHGRWDQELEAPGAFFNVRVEIHGVAGQVRRVWWTSPDGDRPDGDRLKDGTMAPQPLAVELTDDEQGQIISFSLPTLAYWNLVVVESAGVEESHAEFEPT